MHSEPLQGQDLETAVARAVGYYERLNASNLRPPAARIGDPPPPRYLMGQRHDDLIVWLCKHGNVQITATSHHAFVSLHAGLPVANGRELATAAAPDIYAATCRLVLTVASSRLGAAE